MVTLARRIALALVVGLVFSAPASFTAKDKKEEHQEPPKPTLNLQVTPRHGFRPVTFTLTGSLDGVSDNDEQYCHPGLEWEWISPYGMPMTSKEDPRCLHPPEQTRVVRTFTKVVTINDPGRYAYRLILYRRDGERIISNSTEVRVLDTQ